MIPIQYPEPHFKIKQDGEKHYLFDTIRKVWLQLTEEEWVRQNFVHYLVATLHYPTTAIALEKEIKLGELKKRFDILVFDPNYHPWMLIECKAPDVALNEDVLQQVLRYNISVPVSYIIITNGEHTIGWQKQEGQLMLLNEMPKWE